VNYVNFYKNSVTITFIKDCNFIERINIIQKKRKDYKKLSMKLSIRYKLLILAFIILAGNGIIGYTFYSSNEKFIKSEQLVQHSLQVISLSGNILSLGKDIKSASLGYIITKDSSFLEPLFAARNSIFTNIRQLNLLVQDSHSQTKRVDSIRYYIEKRLTYSLQQIEIRSKQGLMPAIIYTSNNQGKYFFDRIRLITIALQAEETTLLTQRRQTTKDSAKVFTLTSQIMYFLMMIITVLLFIATNRNFLQKIKREKRAAELVIANKEIAFQNEEKGSRASELIVANKELVFQNEEREKRAAELIIANKELAFQNEEKESRASELIVANKELVFQNEEREKRAAELIIANKELVFQNEEKEKRTEELITTYQKLVFQNEEKEKRAAELIIADKELVFQKNEKGKRAAELVIVNKEIVFQNEEKEKRAAELIIADKELVFQKNEKGKRAAELVIVNKELVFQSEEKEKQEAANNELEAFSYSVSHDLRAPLRHIGGFVDLLIKNSSSQLDETGLRYLNIISESSHEMGDLIDALLTFSRLSRTELRLTKINSKKMVNHVIESFSDELAGRNVEINISELPDMMGDEILIKQVWVNLISNAIKYSRNKEKAIIDIGGKIENDKMVYSISDNGAGFDMKFADKLFGVFQRLHKARDFEGIGIGLANVNRIIVRHGGKCWADSEVDKGATFFFSVPNN